ncbi:MAG TPA: hypothetical protein VL356_01535 [Acidocella sp.]|nr:hypothetical protein [Acidocella sp.]
MLQAEVSDKESGRFLKKAAQKLLLLWACGIETSTAQIKKVFLLLFVHKKKPFPWLVRAQLLQLS